MAKCVECGKELKPPRSFFYSRCLKCNMERIKKGQPIIKRKKNYKIPTIVFLSLSTLFFIGTFLDATEWAIFGFIAFLLTIYFSTFIPEIPKKLTLNPPFYWHLRVFIIYILLNFISLIFFNFFLFIGILGLVFMYFMATYNYKQAIKKGEDPKAAYLSGVFSVLFGLIVAALLLSFLGLLW